MFLLRGGSKCFYEDSQLSSHCALSAEYLYKNRRCFGLRLCLVLVGTLDSGYQIPLVFSFPRIGWGVYTATWVGLGEKAKGSGIAMMPPKDAATAMVCEAGWAVHTVLWDKWKCRLTRGFHYSLPITILPLSNAFLWCLVKETLLIPRMGTAGAVRSLWTVAYTVWYIRQLGGCWMYLEINFLWGF